MAWYANKHHLQNASPQLLDLSLLLGTLSLQILIQQGVYQWSCPHSFVFCFEKHKLLWPHYVHWALSKESSADIFACYTSTTTCIWKNNWLSFVPNAHSRYKLRIPNAIMQLGTFHQFHCHHMGSIHPQTVNGQLDIASIVIGIKYRSGIWHGVVLWYKHSGAPSTHQIIAPYLQIEEVANQDLAQWKM